MWLNVPRKIFGLCLFACFGKDEQGRMIITREKTSGPRIVPYKQLSFARETQEDNKQKHEAKKWQVNFLCTAVHLLSLMQARSPMIVKVVSETEKLGTFFLG